MKSKIMYLVVGVIFIVLTIININFSTNIKSDKLVLSSIVNQAFTESELDPNKYTVWHFPCFDGGGNPTGKQSASCASLGTEVVCHSHTCIAE